MTFDMSLEDAVELSNRLYVSQDSYDCELSLDGKIWDCNENRLYRIYRYQDAGDKTAQEIFEAYGTSEVPDNSLLWLIALSDTARAELSVPDTVQAVKYVGLGTYDEETDTDEQYPIHISSVKVSDWKKISLMNMLVNTDTLTVSGNGTTELLNSRVNGRVTADTLKINVAAAVLNLTCRNLDASDANRLVVGEYPRQLLELQFDAARAKKAGVPVSLIQRTVKKTLWCSRVSCIRMIILD